MLFNLHNMLIYMITLYWTNIINFDKNTAYKSYIAYK